MPSSTHNPEKQSLIRRWKISCSDCDYHGKGELIVGNPAIDPVSISTLPTYDNSYCHGESRKWIFHDASAEGPSKEPQAGLRLLVDIDHSLPLNHRSTPSPCGDADLVFVDAEPVSLYKQTVSMMFALIRECPGSVPSLRSEGQGSKLVPRPFPIYCPDDDSGTSISTAACALLAMYFEYPGWGHNWYCDLSAGFIGCLQPQNALYGLSWSGDLDLIVQKLREQNICKRILGVFVVIFVDGEFQLSEIEKVRSRCEEVTDDIYIGIATRGRPTTKNDIQLPFASLFITIEE